MADQQALEKIQELLSGLQGDTLQAALSQLTAAQQQQETKKPEPVKPAVSSDSVHLCPIHNKELDFYDYDEKTIICSHCALFGKHKEHERITLKEALERSLPDLDEQTHIHESQLKLLNERRDLTDRLRKSAEASTVTSLATTKAHFADIRATLEKRETELLEEIEAAGAKKDAHYDDVLTHLGNDIKRSKDAIAERQGKIDSRDPFTILEMRTQHDDLRTEMADVIDTVHPQAEGTMQVALPPTITLMLDHHGAMGWHRSLDVLEKQRTFGDLNIGDFNYIADEVLSKRKITVQQMIGIVSTRMDVNNDVRRALTRIKQAGPPDESQLMRAAWNVVLGEWRDVGTAIADMDNDIKRDVVGMLGNARDSMPKTIEALTKAMDKDEKGVAAAAVAVKKACAEAQALESRVVKIIFDQRSGKSIPDKKVRKEHDKYVKAVNAYTARFTEYTRLKDALDGAIKLQLGQLEEAECGRVDEVKAALNKYVEHRTRALIAESGMLGRVTERIHAMDPRFIISQIAALSSAKAPRVEEAEAVDEHTFPLDLIGVADGATAAEMAKTQSTHAEPESVTAPVATGSSAPPPPPMPGVAVTPAQVTQDPHPATEADLGYGCMEYDYEATADDELTVTAGEFVTIQTFDPEGWSKVTRVTTGDVGSIPSQYLRRLTAEEYAAESGATTQPEPAPEPAPEVEQEPVPEAAAEGFPVRVLYDYEAADEGELTVTVGQLLTVTNVYEGWYDGVDADGNTGMFPDNYVERL